MSALLTYVSCIHIATTGVQRRIAMGSLRQTSSLVHDPLGLLALPMTSTGQDRPDEDGPRPGIEGAKSSGMAIAAKTLAAALIPLLIAVSLVALPGPAN